MKKYKLPLQDSSEIIFRTLSSEESDRYYSALISENPDIEEYIFNIITDHKYEISTLNAGIIPTTIFCALKLSGAITKKEQVPNNIEKARKNISDNLYYRFYKTIVQAQPSYKMADLKQLTFAELMEEFAFSEAVLGKQCIDLDKMRELLDKESDTEEFKPKKGIKSVTPEEIDAIRDYFKNNEMNGQFIDDRL